MEAIRSFWGEHRYLSNFYLRDVAYNGWVYKSTEHAYQCQKTEDERVRRQMYELSPGQIKRFASKVVLRDNWEHMKNKIMYDVVFNKFAQNVDLKRLLVDTGNALLEEGNTWGDTYWGTVDGVGQNMLGHILMNVRSELR
jgi:ribA/ribD-fused uncharacterized protein